MGKKHKKIKKPEEKAIGFGVIQIPYRHSKGFMDNLISMAVKTIEECESVKNHIEKEAGNEIKAHIQ